MYVFFIKDDGLPENYNKISDRVRDSIKKDLIVNQYTMKNV